MVLSGAWGINLRAVGGATARESTGGAHTKEYLCCGGYDIPEPIGIAHHLYTLNAPQCQ